MKLSPHEKRIATFIQDAEKQNTGEFKLGKWTLRHLGEIMLRAGWTKGVVKNGN